MDKSERILKHKNISSFYVSNKIITQIIEQNKKLNNIILEQNNKILQEIVFFLNTDKIEK